MAGVRAVHCTQKAPAPPPITLQNAPAANALQDAGSAAPNAVHAPSPPNAIEQDAPLAKNAEQFFEMPGKLRRVEQNAWSGAPTFSTEQELVGSVVSALQTEGPTAFAEHFPGLTGPTTEHCEFGSTLPTLHDEGRPPASGGSTVQAPLGMVTEQIRSTPTTVLQRLLLLFVAEQNMPGVKVEQLPKSTSTEQPEPAGGPGGMVELPIPWTGAGGAAGVGCKTSRLVGWR